MKTTNLFGYQVIMISTRKILLLVKACIVILITALLVANVHFWVKCSSMSKIIPPQGIVPLNEKQIPICECQQYIKQSTFVIVASFVQFCYAQK